MKHHKLIKSLIEEIKTLRNQINELSEFNSSQYKKLRDECDRIERQGEHERREQQFKQWQREDLMDNLERKERMGDEWGASRTKKELRNL